MQHTEALLDMNETSRISGGFSAATIMRRVKRGEFPEPVVLSRYSDGRPARIAFVESEVRAWVVATIAKERARRDAREAALEAGREPVAQG